MKNDNKVFSNTFVTYGESLPIELIKGNASSQITSYGPDFSRYLDPIILKDHFLMIMQTIQQEQD